MQAVILAGSSELTWKDTIMLIFLIVYSKTNAVQNFTTLSKTNADAGLCDSEKYFILHQYSGDAVNSNKCMLHDVQFINYCLLTVAFFYQQGHPEKHQEHPQALSDC